MRWKRCTVTVIDTDGKPHSALVYASSALDAARWYTIQTQEQDASPHLPKPTPETVFCVQFDGQPTSERITWRALQAWIKRQQP